MPETSDTSRWLGVVIGVGDGVKDIQFGDLMELPRWGGTWWYKPGITLTGGFVTKSKIMYLNMRGSGQYEASGQDMVTLREPGEILYRIQRMMGDPKEEPGIYPIADRILVRQQVPPKESDGGIYLVDWTIERSVVGEVLAVGGQVLDVKPGQCVIGEEDRGSYFDIDGVPHAIIRERDIMTAYDAAAAPGWVTVRKITEPRKR